MKPCLRYRLFAVAALLATLQSQAVAQGGGVPQAMPNLSDRFFQSFGLFGAIGSAWHSGQLAIPDYADCARFSSGSGAAIAGGGLIEFQPAVWSPLLQLRIGVAPFSGTFTHTFDAGPIRAADGQLTRAIIDNILDATRLDGVMDLSVVAPIAGRLRGRAGLGLQTAINQEYRYSQRAVSPPNLLLAGRRQQQIQQGGIFAASAFTARLSGGVGYGFPIGERSWLEPELSVSYSLTSLVGGNDWRSLQLVAGGALRFGFPAELPPPPPPDTLRVPPPPPPPPPLPALAAAIRTNPDTVRVSIEEQDSIETLPLLNQIFFAEGSNLIPERYRQLEPQAVEGFGNAQLIGSALDVYYHLLNIIGMRMRRTPDAILTITGHRNGGETEPRLARQRAESVKQYLVEVWRVPSRRIRVVGGGMPASPASEAMPEGAEENARVEITSSDLNIIGPVIRRHIQRIATPPSITFYPSVVAEGGLAQWSLDVLEQSSRWKSFAGGQQQLPDSIVWEWRNDRGELPSLPMQLQYALRVTDSTGANAATPLRQIDVAYTPLRDTPQNDTAIENYSLLLFNFDSPTISRSDMALLKAIIAQTQSGAIVRLVGYTDSLGDDNHNRQLAIQRANEVAKIFRSLAPKTVSVVVDESACGERERFPYNTPEGRSHCRTVMIEIRTPTSKSDS